MSTAQKALPKVDGDFYHVSATMSEEDQALLRRVRIFMETEVAPIINGYWTREEFPHHTKSHAMVE
jgi:glutaryl-CoA dehydrogenase